VPKSITIRLTGTHWLSVGTNSNNEIDIYVYIYVHNSTRKKNSIHLYLRNLKHTHSTSMEINKTIVLGIQSQHHMLTKAPHWSDLKHSIDRL
jgi:hypothetical protein